MSDDRSEPDQLLAASKFVHPGLDEFRERIWHLATIADGWYGGIGSAPSLAGLVWLGDNLVASTGGRIPLPFLYPTPEGAIRCEWMLGRRDASIEVDLRARRGDFHVLDLDRGEVGEVRLDQILLDGAGWDRVVAQLAGTPGASP